jgi:hypothetical protein
MRTTAKFSNIWSQDFGSQMFSRIISQKVFETIQSREGRLEKLEEAYNRAGVFIHHQRKIFEADRRIIRQVLTWQKGFRVPASVDS